MRRDVFQAIADPTRREIISILSKQSLNLNSLADRFDISRPAVSRHIRILTECGIIVIKQQGRERFCETDLKSFDNVSQWVEECRTFWLGKLDALETFLQEVKKADKPRKLKPVKAAGPVKPNSSIKNKKS